MGILFIDGQRITNNLVSFGIGPVQFKWRASNANCGWDIATSGGRWGLGALTGESTLNDLRGQLMNVAGVFVPENDLACGFALLIDTLPADPWVVAGYENGLSFPNNFHMQLVLFADGSVRVQSSLANVPTTLATSTGPVYTPGARNHFQFKADVPGVNSGFRVRVNDTEVVWDSPNSGLTLHSGTAAQFRRYYLGHTSPSVLTTQLEVNDYYLTDGAMLGDCMVETLEPTADGTYQGFELGFYSSLSHWQTINNSDTGPNDGSPFITCFDIGGISTFLYDQIVDWPDDKAVLGVQIYTTLSTLRWSFNGGGPSVSDANVVAFADLVVLYAGSTAHSAEAIAGNRFFSTVSPAPQRKHHIVWDTNPANSGAPWTVGQVNAAEFGVSLSSGVSRSTDTIHTDVTSSEVSRPPPGPLAHVNVQQVPVEVLIQLVTAVIVRRHHPPQLIGQ